MPSAERHLEADVAVIGAGLAGLITARQLAAAGVDVVVLEARNRPGGRTLNHEIDGAHVVEVGGQWVGPTQHRVSALIGELGLATFDTYTSGANLFEHDGRLRRYPGEIPRVNPVALADVQLAMTRLERMAKQVDPAAPWEAARADRWDAETVASWTRRQMGTALGRTLIALACEAVWAADPADVSLLHFLAYASSAGGLNQLISTDGGAQQSRVVGGSQLIALRLAEQLGDRVVYDAPITAISHEPDVRAWGSTVEVSARRAVLAMSPALTGRLAYTPALPAHRDQLTQRMPNGSVIKCNVVYDEPFWRAAGLSGQVTSDTGPVKVVFDNSPPDGRPGVLLGFLEGDQARRLGRLGPTERQRAVVDCLTRFFGNEASRPLEYVERDWSAEEWTRGCYGAFLPPHTWTAFGSALRTPIGNLHWAGAETATEWMGYMDGAVQSGERAAAEVLEHLSG